MHNIPPPIIQEVPSFAASTIRFRRASYPPLPLPQKIIFIKVIILYYSVPVSLITLLLVLGVSTSRLTKSQSADDDSESELTVITCDDGRNNLFLTLGLFICDNKRSSSESDEVDEELSHLGNLDRDMANRPFE